MQYFTALPSVHAPDPVLCLQEEIAILERRLENMGVDGDCAYERAMSRLYTAMVKERKQRLVTLHCPRSS